MSKREEIAKQLFLNGCNCSQAVACSFEDLIDIDHKLLLKMMSSFGGGVGRMREVCGAVSGMAFVTGVLYGYDDLEDYQAKKEHYARIQYLADQFKKEHGSIVCREILNEKQSKLVPEQRTDDFYSKRPCLKCVMDASRILDEYIETHPITK